MEWRKVKNIIILLLLLVNGFLLVLVWARRSEALQYEQTAMTQAIQALANQGIEVEWEALTSADGLFALSLERDAEREEQLVQALLGETAEGDNRGGGLYIYQGQRGEVSLRPGGELSATLYEDERWQTDEPAAHAAELLRQMGVEGEQISCDERTQTTVVMFGQLWEGMRLFSNVLTFTYREGRLQSITGSLLVSGTVTREPGEVLSLPTALMRFLDNILDSGDVCSVVLSMKAGYRASQSFSGVTRLSPTWLISSNTADYYLDASTGTLTRITDR